MDLKRGKINLFDLSLSEFSSDDEVYESNHSRTDNSGSTSTTNSCPNCLAQTCACRDAEIKELASKLALEIEEKKQQQKKKVAKEKSKATKAKRKKIKHWRPEVLDSKDNPYREANHMFTNSFHSKSRNGTEVRKIGLGTITMSDVGSLITGEKSLTCELVKTYVETDIKKIQRTPVYDQVAIPNADYKDITFNSNAKNIAVFKNFIRLENGKSSKGG